MFLHDYLLACEISTVRTQTLTFIVNQEGVIKWAPEVWMCFLMIEPLLNIDQH